MLSDKTRQAIRDGAYRLLLGAGFTADSHSADGRKLPLGQQLKDELSEAFGLPSNHSLARLTGAIDDLPALDRFFQSRFRNCRPLSGLAPLTQYTWTRVYTFNIDDLLCRLYDSADAHQRIQTTTFNRLYHQSSDPQDLVVVHLHGSVLHPEDGYIFSHQDYGGLAARESTWFKILVDEMAAYPFIIIGASLEEPDLEYYLQKRKGTSITEGQIAPSIYVDPYWDKVKERMCERLGLSKYEGTAEDFLREVVCEVGTAPRPIDLITRHMQGRVVGNSRSHRIFSRQWLWVAKDELPKSPDEQPDLLRGIEPAWSHIESSQDVIRGEVSDVVNAVSSWLTGPKDKGQIHIISSTPGQGKSCLLMRLALELAQINIPVYYYNVGERLDQQSALEALNSVQRTVLVVDNIADHGHQIANLIRALSEKRVFCFVLGAERNVRMRQFLGAIYDLPHSERRIRNLSPAEARDLASRLREHGLLGLNAGRPDEEIGQLLTRDLVSGLVTVSSSYDQINAFLDAEVGDLSDDARDIYLTVALAHSRGYAVRTSVLARVTQLPTGKMRELFQSELSGLVRGQPPHGEYRTTRHRVLATKLFDRVAINDRAHYFERLLTALAPYVNRETVIRGTPEARLAGSLMDYDKSVKLSLGSDRQDVARFYRAIRDAWKWNSRYWEQLALMSSENNLADALRYAQHAVGIEDHRVTLTTLSKVQFMVARSQIPAPSASQHARDALSSSRRAIDHGRRRRSPDLYPFVVALRGITDFAEGHSGGWDVPTDIATVVNSIFHESEAMLPKRDWQALKERWSAATAAR